MEAPPGMRATPSGVVERRQDGRDAEEPELPGIVAWGGKKSRWLGAALIGLGAGSSSGHDSVPSPCQMISLPLLWPERLQAWWPCGNSAFCRKPHSPTASLMSHFVSSWVFVPWKPRAAVACFTRGGQGSDKQTEGKLEAFIQSSLLSA